MLDPSDRAILYDELRPPQGMVLDYALGTTFSVDLEALLYVPVTFALFDAHAAESGDLPHQLSIMEALRRHADHTDLFCQAGQIGLPSYKPVFAFIEDSLHPCMPHQRHRIFHPKVWILRFAAEQSVSFRLLCLSRNLTLSRSWDTLLRLDGTPGSGPVTTNRPLVDFVRALPALTTRPVAAERATNVERLATELETVIWEVPDGFDDPAFLPFGTGREATLGNYERLLVIAPFASASQLIELTDQGAGHVLVSRSETLDRMSAVVLDRFRDVFVLNSAVTATEDAPDVPPEEVLAEEPAVSIAGLHAKVFVCEQGDRARVVTGSPNATEAAFSGNVELAVSLSGPVKLCGVDALLGADGGDPTEPPLRAFLDRYLRDHEPVEPSATEDTMLRLAELGRRVSALAFTIEVVALEDDLFELTVATDAKLPALDGATAQVWPISLGLASATEVDADQPVELTFGGLSLQAITSFVAIRLSEDTPDGEVAITVVVNGQLVGAPADRRERILTAELDSVDKLLRYLLFLLADVDGDPAAAGLARLLTTPEADGGRWALRVPLFESMVRALARNPQTLDHVALLVNDLSRTDEGRELLGELRLEEVWPPIWEARQEVAR